MTRKLPAYFQQEDPEQLDLNRFITSRIHHSMARIIYHELFSEESILYQLC